MWVVTQRVLHHESNTTFTYYLESYLEGDWLWEEWEDDDPDTAPLWTLGIERAVLFKDSVEAIATVLLLEDDAPYSVLGVEEFDV